MDLFEAFGLLGLDTLAGVNYNDCTTKDVGKCFRQQALKHHPDKGGDASHFQLLKRAKCMLLEHIAGNGGSLSCKVNDCNSTAVSTSLYEHEHRTCIRQVLVLHGSKETVIAATDDGLIVTELKKDANYYLSGGLERIVSFTTHRDDSFFLCCTACPTTSIDIIYAGTKDSCVHRIELSTHRMTSWQHPNRKGIVSISTVQNWVAIATANGGIYILEYRNDADRPTIVWNSPADTNTGAHTTGQKCSSLNISPETILLQEGTVSNYLNLWIGGSSFDNGTGIILMWELDIEDDFFERCPDDAMQDMFSEYAFDDSETDSDNDSEGNESAHNAPAINVSVEEGPVYSLAKHDRIVAVTSGQCILVWDWRDKASSYQNQCSRKELTRIKTIKTNNQTLYTLCINERFLAAAGSGESIMVWDRELWTLLHYLPLQKHPSGCWLATNCIMTLDWFHDDSGILVSGGYDGVVTMWTMANRLK